MRKGKSIVELAREIERQQQSKVDYIADTSALQMRVQNFNHEPVGIPVMELDGDKSYPLTQHAHRQIAARLDIPTKYYERMVRAAPELLAANVNEWMVRQDEKRMIRTLDNSVRAFLSDKFRPLENIDLAEAVLPILEELQIEVLSSEITETRMYIKGVHAGIQRDIPAGRRMGDGSHVIFDTLSPAIVISNSEVGSGALSVETAVYTKACTNLAVFGSRSMRKYHVGARADIGEEVLAMLSETTRRVTDAAVWHQVRDIVRGAFDKARFDASVDEIKGMTSDKIEGDPVKVVEVAAKQFGITDGERGSVLKHLIQGGELSRYGLFNAITRTAEDLSDYDRATEFEHLGGKVIELRRNEWQTIADAGKERLAA